MAMKIITGRTAGPKGESSYTLNKRIFTDVNCTKIVDASEKPKAILGDEGSKIPLSVAQKLGLTKGSGLAADSPEEKEKAAAAKDAKNAKARAAREKVAKAKKAAAEKKAARSSANKESKPEENK